MTVHSQTHQPDNVDMRSAMLLLNFVIGIFPYNSTYLWKSRQWINRKRSAPELHQSVIRRAAVFINSRKSTEEQRFNGKWPTSAWWLENEICRLPICDLHTHLGQMRIDKKMIEWEIRFSVGLLCLSLMRVNSAIAISPNRKWTHHLRLKDNHSSIARTILLDCPAWFTRQMPRIQRILTHRHKQSRSRPW